jgi:hypothetical protein
VRTKTWDCRFIVNDHASWSPDGTDFAFAAGSFDGEGGRDPLTLWIYRGRPGRGRGAQRLTRANNPMLATPNTSGPSQAARSGGMFSFFPSASVNWANAR